MMALNPADSGFQDKLRSLLPPDTIRPLDDKYLREERGRYTGIGGFLVAPRTVDDVATIVRACNTGRIGLIPYGGGTGYVCGHLAKDGPPAVILTTERMTKIGPIWPEENVIAVEAGAVLSEVQAAAASADRLFPLSLASQGSCRLGGNLATNAGGVNVLRYGNTRDLCLGIEAVLGDGTVVRQLNRLRKDNTGYDIRNLLIGSEGTLGIITAARLRLFARPYQVMSAVMAVSNPQAALSLLSLAQKHMGDTISAFELIDRTAMTFVARALPDIRQPFKQPPDWMVLIDYTPPRIEDAGNQFEALFTQAYEQGYVSDGVIGQSQAHNDELWKLRESIPEANRRIGAICSHDISLPLGEVAAFIQNCEQLLARLGQFRINCFGHLGDGNLHYNVFPADGVSRDDHLCQAEQISEVVHDLASAMGGSVSAEHGIGRAKVEALEKYGDPGKVHAMRAIKAALDPVGIMNPGAMLR
jgi:FAD/FMN-containing dehydrogenase